MAPTQPKPRHNMLSARIEWSLRRKVNRLAKKMRRDVSDIVVFALEEYVERELKSEPKTSHPV